MSLVLLYVFQNSVNKKFCANKIIIENKADREHRCNVTADIDLYDVARR